MHLQRNATQRNAYQNYILLLTNNFKFYILQILGHLNFLSVFFRFAKNQFASLITRGFPKGRRANPLHALAFVYNGLKPHCYSDFAFSYALKNQFEIISRNENYAFNHNKNFCRNGNNIFLRNGYGGNFIFDFWNNSNFGFLFNRKINSKKILFQKEKKR